MHANTYQALRCEQLSEDLSGLRFVELPVTPPGPGQVAVSMRAAALNFPDLLMTRGGYQHKPELTYTVGMEGAGVIEAVGEGVTGWREGDAVCFSNLVGSIAQRNLLPATALEPVPAGWDWASAAGWRVISTASSSSTGLSTIWTGASSSMHRKPPETVRGAASCLVGWGCRRRTR